MRTRAVLRFLLRAYFVLVFGVELARLARVDSHPWLFALEAAGPWLYAPAALAAPLSLALRSVDLRVASLLAAAIVAARLGPLWLPDRGAELPSDRTIAVAQYNLLATQPRSPRPARMLAEVDADVVGLVELNGPVAAALEAQLADRYPFRILRPRSGPEGDGLLSRHPLVPLPDLDGAGFVRAPLCAELDVRGRRLRVAVFHALPPGVGRDVYAAWVPLRLAGIATLAAFARASPCPVIALGDLNASDMHPGYRIAMETFADAWREKGEGFGFTWPGFGGAFGAPKVLGLPVPSWLTRIDYVLHTRDLAARSAEVGPWDGYSDHRLVRATLGWTDAK